MVDAALQVNPLASQVEVDVTAPSQEQPDTAMAVSEGAAQSVPSAALAAMPEAGWMEEDTDGGSPSIMAVVERTSGGSPLALMSGGSCSPTQGELPL